MARRTTPPPPRLISKIFTAQEIDTGIKKLRRRIDDVKNLESAQVGHNDPKVDVVESDIRNTVRDVFGAESPEYNEHQYHRIWRGPLIMARDDYATPAYFKAGIQQSLVTLEGLVSRLEEKRADLGETVPVSPSPALNGGRRVFLVHGHDDAVRLSAERFLRQLLLEPVVLSDRANEGRTIIEKFEHHSDVSFAVVLLTPDDVGAKADPVPELKPRARQNVVLELGYFLGRLSRKRVCALHRGAVELPSDLHGVLYVSMDEADWKLKLAKEMRAAGLDVDMNLALE